MKRQFFAVGWASISDVNYPEPTGKNTTFAVFANEMTAKRFAEAHGGCKVRPVEISLKFVRFVGRATDGAKSAPKKSSSKAVKRVQSRRH